MTESEALENIMAEIGSNPRAIIWRNSTGVARSMDGKRVISFGKRGSPDIVGALAVTIKPEHVGQTWGRALGIEVKSPTGTQSEDQRKFEAAWTRRVSGLYVVARTAADVQAVIEAVQ